MHHRTAVASLTLALSFGLALACAKPMPTEPPLSVSPLTLSGADSRLTDQVMVLTDASGTMYRNVTFPTAKALTQTFVAALPAADVRSVRPGPYQAGIIGFGGTERMVAPLADFNRGALAGTADQLHIMGAIDGMGGETPYRHVLAEVGSALAGRSGQAAVVIFSDGLPDYPDRALAAAQAMPEGYNGKVCIHAVQTGNDPDGAAFLKQLVGTTSCGSYRTADSIRDPNAFMSFMRTVMLTEVAPVAGPCEGVIRLRGVEFDFDKSNIKPESAVVLDVAVDTLQQCTGLRVRVEGYTDWIGTEAYNQGLSERRANSVKDYLVQHGIAAGRLEAKGFGESNPIAPNTTADGRARNRRVELHPYR